MVAEYLWLFAIAGGAFLLGCAIAYGMLTNRSRSEQDALDRKMRKLYEKPPHEASR
ncbi:hypothetical protein [Rhizobium mongolense]|uniref:Uncharacterized protein n=1 Tax=Rhizobium mongolense TaxID=57676 RepID=A0A7W6RKK2_9HYPH|nr:hypothetical protein [Rhizobium mongolense]MBB4273989.1 hypothetical protein [Rhizobium mongolense]